MTMATGSPFAAPSADEGAGLDSYLGAARVVRVAQRSLHVALEEATEGETTLVYATLALAFPYEPIVGDQVLVVSDAHEFFVIGVLCGRGPSALSSPLGVSLRAESGRLQLVGERGVRLRGNRIRLEAQRLRRLAVTAVETFGERVTRVRESRNVEAGGLDELSQGRWLLQARTVVLKALNGVRIKSAAVRVG